ncbi:MAG: thiamine phosphate synthase [Arcobacteraceae bacterium]|jgi:thiamine-phosphate pyrophosphorylase|nr:thiamine phosphate synthase [Arcobacteraceae bacterium]
MKSYLITDPKYYTDNPQTFGDTLSDILRKHKVDYACFRDKSSSNLDELIKTFVNICKKLDINNILINSYIDLAIKHKANGVHLTSSQFGEIAKAKDAGLFVVISCHSMDDIKKAKTLGADAVTYSPVFKTPDKGKPIGLEALDIAKNEVAGIMIFALGGIIAKEQVDSIKQTKADGFASIRYFV